MKLVITLLIFTLLSKVNYANVGEVPAHKEPICSEEGVRLSQLRFRPFKFQRFNPLIVLPPMTVRFTQAFLLFLCHPVKRMTMDY